MKKSIYIQKNRVLIWVLSIWGLWYVFFNASLTLRPLYNFLWPLLVICSLLVNCNKIVKISKMGMNKIYILYALFIMACLVTFIYTRNLAESYEYVQRIFLAVLFSMAITANNNKDDDVILKVIAFFSVIMLLTSFCQFLIPSLYNNVILPLCSQHNSWLVVSALKSGEAVGLTNGTSQNGLFMAIGFVVFACKAFSQKRLRSINIFMAILFFGMTFATGKRSYSLILIILLIILLNYSFKSKHTVNKYIGILIILISLYFVFSFASSKISALNTIYDKFFRLSNSGDVSNGRFSIYTTAWQAFKEYPFEGIGVNTSLSVFGSDIHNSYLQWLVEFGFPLIIIPIIVILNIPLLKIRKVTNYIKNVENEQEKFIILCYFTITILILLSAIVAMPFQWPNIFMIYIICQMNTYKHVFVHGVDGGDYSEE